MVYFLPLGRSEVPQTLLLSSCSKAAVLRPTHFPLEVLVALQPLTVRQVY